MTHNLVALEITVLQTWILLEQKWCNLKKNFKLDPGCSKTTILLHI